MPVAIGGRHCRRFYRALGLGGTILLRQRQRRDKLCRLTALYGEGVALADASGLAGAAGLAALSEGVSEVAGVAPAAGASAVGVPVPGVSFFASVETLGLAVAAGAGGLAPG